MIQRQYLAHAIDPSKITRRYCIRITISSFGNLSIPTRRQSPLSQRITTFNNTHNSPASNHRFASHQSDPLTTTSSPSPKILQPPYPQPLSPYSIISPSIKHPPVQMKQIYIIPILLISLAIFFYIVGRLLRAWWLRRVIRLAGNLHPEIKSVELEVGK